MNEKVLKEGAATRVRNGVGGKLYLTSQKLSFKGHDFNIGEKEFEVGLEKISDVSAKGINRLCVLLKDGTREDFRVYGKDVWVDIIKNTITLLSNNLDSYSEYQIVNDDISNNTKVNNIESNNDNINENNTEINNNNSSASALIITLIIFGIIGFVFYNLFFKQSDFSNSKWVTDGGTYEMTIRNGSCSITMNGKSYSHITCKYEHHPYQTEYEKFTVCVSKKCQYAEIYNNMKDFHLSGYHWYLK